MFKSFVSMALVATLTSATQLDSDAERWGRGSYRPSQFAGKFGNGAFKEKLMDRFDLNDDGELDQSEKQAARGSILAKGMRENPGRVAQAMKRADTDGDGKLSVDEREAARANRQEKIASLSDDQKEAARAKIAQKKLAQNPDRAAKIVERFDANDDGKLDQGEREAAKAALQEKAATRSDDQQADTREAARAKIAQKKMAQNPTLAAKILERFDADDDGKLDQEEREAAMAARQNRASASNSRRSRFGRSRK